MSSFALLKYRLGRSCGTGGERGGSSSSFVAAGQLV